MTNKSAARIVTGGKYRFDFVVDASHSAMGVVRDVYVECRSTRLPEEFGGGGS
jgi:hypothetical protein